MQVEVAVQTHLEMQAELAEQLAVEELQTEEEVQPAPSAG